MGLQTDDFEQPPRISRASARFGKSGKGCEARLVAFERPQNVFGSTSNSLKRQTATNSDRNDQSPVATQNEIARSVLESLGLTGNFRRVRVPREVSARCGRNAASSAHRRCESLPGERRTRMPHRNHLRGMRTLARLDSHSNATSAVAGESSRSCSARCHRQAQS